MKENKGQINKLLIPVVLLVWGLIIYKVLGSIDNSGDSNMNYTSSVPEEESKEVTRLDTTSIVADYRDPFLGRATSGKVSQNILDIGNKSKLRVNDKQNPVSWPEIIYLGAISNSLKNQKTGLVSISGKAIIVTRNYTLQENIKVLELYNDSIRLIRDGQVMTIKKISR